MIQDFFARLQNTLLVRYIFIGGIAYVVEMAVLLSLANLAHLSPQLSVACSFWVGLVVSFVLQKYLAFGNREGSKKAVGTQIVLYGSLVVFNYIFTIIFVALATSLVGLAMSRTIALVATTFWNYLAYKKIFKVSRTHVKDS